jgi:hypothetical protein
MPTAATADAASCCVIERNLERSRFQLRTCLRRSRCAGPVQLAYPSKNCPVCANTGHSPNTHCPLICAVACSHRPSDATTGDGARPSARRAYPPGRKRGRTPFSVLALWAARIAIRPALPTPAAARPERARASRQQAIPADRRSRRELRVCGVVRALNCIVRPAQWVRGGRLAKGAAFAGEAAFGSRLGKREASATARTSSAETVRRLGIRLEATPRLRQAQSACRSARSRAGL